MTQFWGTHQNRLDAKGRVSVPAPFRAALRAQAGVNGEASATLVLRRSHKYPCIDAWPIGEFQKLEAALDRLPMFSEEQDDLALALFADAQQVEPDREGRIVLPDPMVRHAGLCESVAFIGLRRMFQIWEPGAAERRTAEARERANARGFTLPAGGGGVA
jgi:transcriptional regulator MraZ